MIKTQPWTGGTDEEYETQHFGFGAQTFKSAVRGMVEMKITTCVKDMQKSLQNALDLNDTDKETLTSSCGKLIQLYCDRAAPSLDAIDEEIIRVMKVPNNVLLPDDEVQAEQLTDEEYEKLKEEVAMLRKRVERGALMEALLIAEGDELTSIEKSCEVAKKDMDVIDTVYKNLFRDGNVEKVLSETQFLCASAPFMKDSEEVEVFDREEEEVL